MRENTPQLWDDVWEAAGNVEAPLALLEAEGRTVRWRRMERVMVREFGALEGLQVLEIGAGTGVGAALMAARGANVTLADYSPGALHRARLFFEGCGLQAEFRHLDALALPQELRGSHHISMSFGLAEHFLGDARTRIIAAHFEVLKEGGLTFISVPNRWNLPYRFFKFAAERTGRWRVGEEHPFSRAELRAICRGIGVANCSFLGESLLESARFLAPTRAKLWWDRLRCRLGLPRARMVPGTPLDAYLSYALVMYARKSGDVIRNC